MLKITYADQDAALASSIQQDVSASSLTLDHPYLLVLLSKRTFEDASIKSAVQAALAEKQRVVPVLVEAGTPIPAELQSTKMIDLTRGYHAARVIGALKRMEIGEDRITRSWRLLIVGLTVVGIAFIASVWGITQGMIRFPAEEYATENARTDATQYALVAPTLALIVPHSTADAIQFQATLDALPRALKPAKDLAIATATAQARVPATTQP